MMSHIFCDGGTYLELDTKIEIFLEEVRSIKKYHLMDLFNGITISLLKTDLLAQWWDILNQQMLTMCKFCCKFDF